MVPFEKYDALVQLVLQMKREGFAVPSPSPDAPVAMELPAVVEEAVREMTTAGADPGTLIRDAWDLLRGKLDPEAVAAQLRHGQSVEL